VNESTDTSKLYHGISAQVSYGCGTYIIHKDVATIYQTDDTGVKMLRIIRISWMEEPELNM
jgi:hypothetical protein